jgi:hypothetical protein
MPSIGPIAAAVIGRGAHVIVARMLRRSMVAKDRSIGR